MLPLVSTPQGWLPYLPILCHLSISSLKMIQLPVWTCRGPSSCVMVASLPTTLPIDSNFLLQFQNRQFPCWDGQWLPSKVWLAIAEPVCIWEANARESLVNNVDVLGLWVCPYGMQMKFFSAYCPAEYLMVCPLPVCVHQLGKHRQYKVMELSTQYSVWLMHSQPWYSGFCTFLCVH